MLLLLQFLTILSNYISAYVKSKSNIIKFKIAAALFNACAIICSGGIIESIPVFYTIIRSITCLYKDKFKSNKPIYIVLSGYVCIGIYTYIETGSIMSLLPTMASLITSIIIWFANNKGIKIWLSIADSVWIVYYSYSGLYLAALNTGFQILTAVISLIQILTHERKDKYT